MHGMRDAGDAHMPQARIQDNSIDAAVDSGQFFAGLLHVAVTCCCCRFTDKLVSACYQK
jgi:hypothetical protein